MAGALQHRTPTLFSLGYRPPAPEVIVLGVAMLPGHPGSTGSSQPPVAVLH
jgi:putative transposase